MKAYKAVILFDVGNVLFRVKYAEFFIHEIGRDPEDFKGLIDLSFEGKMPDNEVIERISLLCGSSIEQVTSPSEMDKYLTENTDLFDFLGQLPETYAMGIISDMWAIPYAWLENNYNHRLSFFAPHLTFFSNVIGSSKLASGNTHFEKVLRGIDIGRANIIFVDDQEENIQSAQKSGIRTVLCPPFRDKSSWALVRDQVFLEIRQNIANIESLNARRCAKTHLGDEFSFSPR